MVATRNKILACKNATCPIGVPRVPADDCHDLKTFTTLQITAMTKQSILSQ
jgi:hypothetical protein